MNIFIFKLIAWGIGELIIETITFGCVGYIIFSLLKGKDNRWFIGVLGVFVIALLYMFFSYGVLNEMKISFGNKDVYKVVGDNIEDFFQIDIWDIIITFFQVLIGFKLAQIAIRKIFVK